MLCQVDGTEAAVFIWTQPLFTAGIGGFQTVKMRHRVVFICLVDEKYARFAVMVSLFYDLVEEIAGFDGLVYLDADTGFAGLVNVAVEIFGLRVVQIRENQIPVRVSFHCLHEFIGDANREIEIGDGCFTGLAGDELLDIRMVHAQNSHVGTASGTALGYFTESMVVDPQKSNGPGCLTGTGAHDGAFRAQAGERETVATAGLLDQGRIAQCLENAGIFLPHVIADGKNETGSQLSQWSTGTGKGRGIREKLTVRQHFVVTNRGLHNVAAISFFRTGYVVCHPPEGSVNRFRRCSVSIAADIALFKHFAGVLAHFNGR